MSQSSSRTLRSPPSLTSQQALPVLKEAISAYNVDSYGTFMQEGGTYSLRQFFTDPTSIEHAQLPAEAHDPSLSKYIISHVSLPASVAALEGTLSSSWEKWRNDPSITDEDRTIRCLASLGVREALHFRLEAMKVHLLWQAVMQVLKLDPANLSVDVDALHYALRTREIAPRVGILATLEDLLLEATEYGRMLREVRFEDAAHLLQREENANSPALTELRATAEPHITAMLPSLKVAYQVRSQLNAELTATTADAQLGDGVARDMPLLVEMMTLLEQCCGSYLTTSNLTELVSRVRNFSGVNSLLMKVELDVRREAALSLAQALRSYEASEGGAELTSAEWTAFARHLGATIEYRKYAALATLTAALNEGDATVVPQVVESSENNRLFGQGGTLMLLSAYRCLHHDILQPHPYTGVNSHSQRLSRAKFDVALRDTRLLLTPARMGDLAELTRQVQRETIPAPMLAELERATDEADTTFYGELIHYVTLHYINLDPEMGPLSLALRSEDEDDLEIQRNFTADFIAHLSSDMGLTTVNTFIAKVAPLLTQRTFSMHVPSLYVRASIISSAPGLIEEHDDEDWDDVE